MSGAPIVGASISGVIWALILAGVALNAAAQLLLKVATRPLSGVTGFSVQTLIDSGMILLKSGTFWTGMVLRGEPLRMAGGAVQGAREYRVPHVIVGLYRGRRDFGGLDG
jgi:hypothetical protein